MNKYEKELAALYLSACLDEMRIADMNGDDAGKEKAGADYKRYRNNVYQLLEMKYTLFGLDHKKAVEKPLADVMELTRVFYSQRVNGQPLKA